jgi:hypothetical protein
VKKETGKYSYSTEEEALSVNTNDNIIKNLNSQQIYATFVFWIMHK